MMKKLFAVTIYLTFSLTFFSATLTHAASAPIPDDLQATFIISTDGDTVFAENLTTDVTHEGESLSIINNYMSSHTTFYVRNGTYSLDTPINMASHSTVDMESGVIVKLPNGYNEHVFSFMDGVRNAYVKGGILCEKGTQTNPLQHAWTGILMKASKKAIFFNSVRDMWIEGAKRGIHLWVDGEAGDGIKGGIFGNEFKSIRIWHPEIAIEFQNVDPDSNGINYNYFEEILGQSYHATQWGVKNVSGKQNVFMDMKIWDLHMSSFDAISSKITAEAEGTIIIGGHMALSGSRVRFIDNGVGTHIIDMW